MATKSPTQSLPEDSPENIEANRKYQEALAKLTDSLDTRKNRLFDPIWLAAAQGFGAPTQTGGFGESLGYAAKNVAAAQEQETKQEQDIAQQRVNVAGQGLELQRQKSDIAAGREWLKSQQPPTPKAPVEGPLSKPSPVAEEPSVVPAKLPVGALSAIGTAPEASTPTTPMQPPVAARGIPPAAEKPPGFENVQGIPIMPPNTSITTKAEFVARNLGRKPLADLMKEGEELELRHRYQKTESGMIDLRTGMEYPKASAERIDIPILGEGYGGKTYSVPKTVALTLGKLQMAGDEEGYKALADRVTGASFGAKKGEPPKRMLSIDERALESEKQKSLQAASVTQEVEDRKNITQRARDSDEAITTANVFRRFAEDPNAKQMFGILNDNKISSGIATLVRDGIGIPGFTVGTKAIEDVMRNANLSAAEQAKYRTFLMYATQMQLQQSKYMKGAVSDFEQRLMANAGITANDTPEAIRMKADLLTRRAQFDRRVAKAFKGSKMTADEFLDSDKYVEMRDKYNEDLSDLTSGSKVLVAPTTAGKAAPGKDLSKARQRVDEILKGK